MLKSERKQLILKQLKNHRTVSLDSLVHILKTSESTVRRDLDELESEQKLRRIHGGAENIHFLQEEERLLLKHLKYTGVTGFQKTSISKIKTFKDNILTYEVAYFICKK